jgi:hypothetical protein
LNQEHLMLVNNLGPFESSYIGEVGVAVRFNEADEPDESQIILNPSRSLTISDFDLHWRTGNLAVARIKQGALAQLLVSPDIYDKLKKHSWVKKCSNLDVDFYDFLCLENDREQRKNEKHNEHLLSKIGTCPQHIPQKIYIRKKKIIPQKACCIVL